MKTDDEKRLHGFSERFLQSSHSVVKHFSFELMPQGCFSRVTGAETLCLRYIRCFINMTGHLCGKRKTLASDSNRLKGFFCSVN